MPETKLSVSLLRYTSDPEETVALAAKLCYSKLDIEELKKGLQEKELKKFIKKILSMGHLSTIEHIAFTFGIEGVSRSLLAQITRHRIASYSVKSQRYVAESKSSNETFNYIIPISIKELGPSYENKFSEQMNQIQEWYDYWYKVLEGNEYGAAEDARFVLPNAAETKMVLTMNARELYHFFKLRCCHRAQWEIRELAWQMLALVRAVAPNIFYYAGPNCIFSKCSEGAMTCGRSAEMIERHKQI